MTAPPFVREISAEEAEPLLAEWRWIVRREPTPLFLTRLGSGLAPTESECIGWSVHPLLGGEMAKSNLKKFSMRIYQSIMGQLHRQLRERG